MAITGASQEGKEDLHALYEDDSERLRHLKAIQTVAGRIGASIEEVGRLYEAVLRDFKRNARVRDFLPILVSRKVEYVLSVRGGKSRALMMSNQRK
ncbi:MAG: DUF3562 domain-containing protein [Nitrospirae bacterium]|nr:DUF3562 domain-containing protein [Nitrospirota bacterium]